MGNLHLAKRSVEEARIGAPEDGSVAGRVRALIRLIRLSHWTKNLLIFVPPFFAGTLMEAGTFATGGLAFLALSLVASVGYIVNDVQDVVSDRIHPRKKTRPLASGRVSLPIAAVLAGLLSAVGVLLAHRVSPWFPAYVVGYLGISVSYSLWLKKVFLVDIFLIASGFIVRVMAGGEAFGVEISSWLFLTMFFSALFLAAGKRMGEIAALREWAAAHRVTLLEYSTDFVQSLLWTAATAALLTYALYTTEGDRKLFYTVPLAAFGVFRYLFLLKRTQDTDPTELLLNDRVLLVTLGVWSLVVGLMMYGPIANG